MSHLSVTNCWTVNRPTYAPNITKESGSSRPLSENRGYIRKSGHVTPWLNSVNNSHVFSYPLTCDKQIVLPVVPLPSNPPADISQTI